MTDQNEQQGYEDGYAGHADSSYLDNLTQNILQIKQQTYSMMRVSEGHTVLDVGCGPASDTIALSKLVGSRGKVIGIDHDPEMVAKANQRAIEKGLADYVEHHLGNGLELPFEDNTFDSCRSERVFQHVPEAEKLLAEMIRVTKPGGYIVVADTDHSTYSTSTQFDDMDLRLRNLVFQLLKNPHVTRKLYAMMNLVGLQEIETNPILLSWTDFNEWRDLAFDIAMPAGLKLGILTQEEFDQYEHDLSQLNKQNAFYAHLAYLLIAGRKPE